MIQIHQMKLIRQLSLTSLQIQQLFHQNSGSLVHRLFHADRLLQPRHQLDHSDLDCFVAERFELVRCSFEFYLILAAFYDAYDPDLFCEKFTTIFYEIEIIAQELTLTICGVE